MTDYFVETGQELAAHIIGFVIEKTDVYIRTSEDSAYYPLDFVRLHLVHDKQNSSQYKVIVQLHKRTDKVDELGASEFEKSVGIPDYELDKFIAVYKVAQIDTRASRGRFMNYYARLIEGEYEALKDIV